MNSHVRPALALLFLYLAVTLPACGTRGKSQTIQVDGIVWRMSLSSTELVIREHDGVHQVWHVAREDEHKLVDLDAHPVTVEGTETVIKLRAGKGKSAETRHILSNITIIAIYPALEPICGTSLLRQYRQEEEDIDE